MAREEAFCVHDAMAAAFGIAELLPGGVEAAEAECDLLSTFMDAVHVPMTRDAIEGIVGAIMYLQHRAIECGDIDDLRGMSEKILEGAAACRLKYGRQIARASR